MAEVGGFTIPRFKERTMYWTLPDKNEQFSYEVSESFRGILRLSPNDDGTLEERNSVNLYGEDETLDVYYKDPVDLLNQFVRASTSDGYLVDLRFGEDSIEFDNLYVIGASFQSQLRVYTKNKESIILDDVTCLPSSYNEKASLGDYKSLSIDHVDIDDETNAADTYILVNRSKEKRVFQFEQIRNIIDEIIDQSLLDLQTVPTGAIQYTPIDLKQYTEMISVGKPNNYYRIGSSTPNDPIVRDYLPCDGSLYKNKDFPELAKILKGEKVVYWELDKEKNKMVKKEHINDYSVEKNFRVPDLRRVFIKSVYIPENKDQLKNSWCETGSWMSDNRPQYDKGKTIQDHRHFITSAHYQENPNMDSFPQVAVKNGDEWTLGASIGDSNPKPGVLSPKNNMNMWRMSTFGDWYNVGRYGWSGTTQLVPSNPCGYFLSFPQEYDHQSMSHEANVGITSEDIPSFVTEIADDNDISYNNRTEYVKFVNTGASSSYGYENVPEYVAMLPLIHI